MHPLLRLGYAAAGQLARLLADTLPAGDAKLLRAIRGRRGLRARYVDWARTHRDPTRPLLWIHAPSVGEGLQARPVLELVRQRRPDVQLAYTFFSPSAVPFARTLDVDFTDYLPFDASGEVDAALDAIRPSALVFSKLDLWPLLVDAASRRGVRLGLISATLAEHSTRRSSLAAALLHDAYARLDSVGAIDESDARRLVSLGVRASTIRVTGDTRYDQVASRAASVELDSSLLAPLAGRRFTLVAGSTWPADERVLLAAWRRLVDAGRAVRLVIAPHEPTAAHLQPIERWAAAAGLSAERLGDPRARAAQVVVVDRVGVLGELYALADAAFVGGGFHAAGLHSVLEPAAFGAPVLFGPRHEASRDAGLLLAAGGGFAVGDEAALVARLEQLLAERGVPDEWRQRRSRARGVVDRGVGAAERSYALVAALLPAPNA